MDHCPWRFRQHDIAPSPKSFPSPSQRSITAARVRAGSESGLGGPGLGQPAQWQPRIAVMVSLPKIQVRVDNISRPGISTNQAGALCGPGMLFVGPIRINTGPSF